MTCHSCGSPLSDGARFCRDCGTAIASAPTPPIESEMVSCPACSATARPGQRFCRACGQPLAEQAPPGLAAALPGDDVETAERDTLEPAPGVAVPAPSVDEVGRSFTREVAWDIGSDALLDRAAEPIAAGPATTVVPAWADEPAPRRTCRVCGAPAAWARDTCEDCDASAPNAAPTEQDAPTPSPPGAGAATASPPRRRRPGGRALAVVVAGLLVAAGATAAFLLTRDSGTNGTDVAEATAAAGEPKVAEDVRLADKRSAADDGAATTPAAVETTADDDAAASGASDDDASADPRVSTPGPADEEAVEATDRAETEAGEENPNSPTGVVRAHWQAVSDGDYQTAYDLFSSRYQAKTSSSRWIAQEEEYAPRVHVETVEYVRATGDARAVVSVDLFTRDMGPKGDSSKCNRFAGKVQVVKEGGTWRYWALAPGATWQGKGTVSRADTRCSSLF